MFFLSKKKLNEVISKRGESVSSLAKTCGISRQSIYNMFGKTSVFNTTFEKILKQLCVEPEDITERHDNVSFFVQKFPDKIKKIILKLSEFAAENHADLMLFGSRALGKAGIRSDWDFALYFNKANKDKEFRKFKQLLMEDAFPYRVDIVNLNNAPEWFLSSVEKNFIYLRREVEHDSKKTFGIQKSDKRSPDKAG
ncbi:MAG: hypothetical protein COV46_02585 [Deltaproteobacteria bacterium CG11_big_fil_rev_8_21_14_0_20_49_13]|nr:MAG: hypothetical protein COV46_02585 [Deltaproteobacteria bacterium CG11_big_fil_rev_8_21_14_0_20_49_13]